MDVYEFQLLSVPMISNNEGRVNPPTRSFKWHIYKLLHSQLQVLTLDNRVFAVLLVIQTIQLLYHTMNADFDFLWKTQVTGYLQSAMRYFDYSSLINTGTAFITLLSFNLVYFLMMFLCVGVNVLSHLDPQAKMTSVKIYSLKILNILVVLLRTVLAIPIWQSVVFGLQGKSTAALDGVSDAVVYACIVSACVSAIVFLVFQCVYNVLFLEVSSFQKTCIAAPFNSNPLIKLLIKMIMSTYMMMDRTKSLGKYYMIFAVLLSALWCFKSYKQMPQYQSPQKYISQLQPVLLFWFSLCVFLQAFICPNESLGLYFTLLGAPLSVLAWWEIKSMKSLDLMCSTYKTINSANQIETYLLTLVEYVKNIGQTEERIKLEGILNYHILSCKRGPQTCNCAEMNAYQKRFKAQNEPSLWYTFIKMLTLDAIQRFPKATRLYIIAAHLQHQQLNNKYRALFSLVSSSQSKPSLVQQFMAYHLQQRIQQKMVEEDMKLNEEKSVDVNRFFQFSNQLLEFREILEETVNSYVQFWTLLMDQTPNLAKIKELGARITRQGEKTKCFYDKLCSLNANNLECLTIYGHFLADVVNDTSSDKIFELAKIIRKNLTANRNFSDEERLKYGENSQTGIIVVSGDTHNLGTVQHCSTQVKTIVGYYMSDLIGQNISRVMPKLIGDHHDEVLKNYLDTNQEKLNGKERFAPMIDKEGFLVPCTLMTKSLPDLEQGIRLVGFFREMSTDNLQSDIQDPYYVLFRQDTQQVQALSQNVYRSFKIRKTRELNSSQLNNQITIKSLFNFSFGDDVQQNSQNGKLAQLNTLLQGGNEQQRTQVNNVFKKQEVVIHQHVSMMFRGITLRLLYFMDKKSQLLQVDSRMKDAERASGVSDREKSMENKSNIDLEQIQVQVNDQTKFLKDFKAMISDKKEPRSIRILKKLGMGLFLIMVGLAIAGLVLFQQRKVQIEEGYQALVLGSQLVGGIAEINYYGRKMQLDSITATPGRYPPLYGQWVFNLSTTLSILQSNQFDLVKLQIQAASKGASTSISSQKWSLSQNGTVLKKTDSLDLILFDYITSSSGLQSSQPSQLNFTLQSTSLSTPPSKQYSNFYNIRYTGLYSLLDDQQTNTLNLYRFYRAYINENQSSFLILLGVALSTLVLAEIVAIPFILSVVKISNKVLSLFGYIQTQSIEGLVRNCEKYLDGFLEDTPTGKMRLKRDIKAMEIASTERPRNDTKSETHDEEVKLLVQPPPQIGQIKRLPTSASKKDNGQQQRCAALMQTKDSSTLNTVLKYTIFLFIFAIYFVSDFFIVQGFLVSSQTGYDVTLDLFQSVNQAKKVKVLTMQSILDNSPFYNKPTLKSRVLFFANELYMTQRRLNGYSATDFHSAFSGYFTYRDMFNNNNLCDLLDVYDDGYSILFPKGAFVREECNGLGKNVLKMGLRPSIVGFLETAKIVVNLTELNGTLQDVSFGLMESMQKYIETPGLQLLKMFKMELADYLQQMKLVFSAKFAVFVVVVLLLFVIAWIPFLRQLNARIWTAKGMLNMLPMSLVTANDKLREQLTSGSILKSVK